MKKSDFRNVEFEIERVTTKEQLDKLYANWAFTVEGLAEDAIPELMSWLKKKTTFKTDKPIVYVTTGAIMNKKYALTGYNAYRHDTNIVSVIDIDLMEVALKRFEIGGRWFTDIVDNKKPIPTVNKNIQIYANGKNI